MRPAGKRAMRTVLWVVLGLAATAATVLLAGIVLGEHKASRRIVVDAAPVAYRTDAQAFALGKYLYESRGCTACHGENGGGKTFVDDPGGVRLRGPNLTSTNPDIRRYNERDWVLAIRHGVAPSGRPLRIMPSEDYNRLSDHDLAALVAYVRSLPAAEGGPAEIRLPLPVRAMYGFGMIPDAAQKIDHSQPPTPTMAAMASAGYGGYVVNACIGCHGERLTGGRIPGAPPDWPPAADLRPGPNAVMSRYGNAAAFVQMMRTGKRPDGSPISPVMPFEAFSRMNDTDLTALYLHLIALPIVSAAR